MNGKGVESSLSVEGRSELRISLGLKDTAKPNYLMETYKFELGKDGNI
jgi:hypothetical protein